MQWFEFVLSLNVHSLNINENNDYEIEDYSSDSTCSYDQKQQAYLLSIHDLVDYNDVKSKLLILGFKPKRELPVLLKPFQFARFGFKNRQDCKLLCQKTKLLIEKYPKNKRNKSKKQNQKTQKDCKSNNGLEGFVQDKH